MSGRRKPSPQICCACFRLHIRLLSDQRNARRSALEEAMAWEEPTFRLYARQLFDHLTLGRKVNDRREPDQLHPAPPTPIAWTAEELAGVDELAIRHAFGLVRDAATATPRNVSRGHPFDSRGSNGESRVSRRSARSPA